MKKLTFLFLLSVSMSYAQVGINTQTPLTTLEVVGTPANTTVADGIIIPKLTGDQLRAKNALYTNIAPNDRTGTMVYVTSADTTPADKTINVTTAGYYFFDGDVWQRVTTGAGTSIYNANDKFTANRTANLDGKTLSFTNTTGTAVANQFSVDGSTFSVDAANDKVGIGTPSPSQPLDINGNVRLRGKIYDNSNNAGANGQVLTTNSSGNVEWQNNVAITPTVLGNLPTTSSGFPNLDTWYYTGASITLPPGKWAVNFGSSFGLTGNIGAQGSLWIRLQLSNSNSTFSLTGDVISGAGFAGAGVASYGMRLSMASGSILINNTSGVNKTYYMWGRNDIQGVNLVERVSGIFTSGFEERWFYANPLN